MRYWLENIKEKIEDFFTNIKYRLGGLTSVFINNNKYIFFIVFLIICVLFTRNYLMNIQDEDDITLTSEILIVKDNIEYEIILNNKDKTTTFREGDFQEIFYTYPRDSKSRISLPDLSKISGEAVISGKKTFVDYSYNIKFTDGCKYLKYLIEDGYSVKMYVSSSQYLEFFLEKDGLMKRLVLFSDTLMLCDMLKDSELPEVWEYLKAYNYNNYIYNKFGVKNDD